MAERDPAFAAKAVPIMALQLDPPSDGPTFCVDEKTRIGVRAPAAPTQPPAPGQPARREHEYVRHGAVDLLAAFCVNTGQVTGIVRARHRSREFLELLTVLDQQVPKRQVIHVILDPVRLHASAEVAVYLYYHPDRFQFHWLPTHASWLSFIEVWFAILGKKCLERADLTDAAAAERWITGFITTYNTHQAKPFTFTKGVRFYQRLKDKLTSPAPVPPLPLPDERPPLAPAA